MRACRGQTCTTPSASPCGPAPEMQHRDDAVVGQSPTPRWWTSRSTLPGWRRPRHPSDAGRSSRTTKPIGVVWSPCCRRHAHPHPLREAHLEASVRAYGPLLAGTHRLCLSPRPMPMLLSFQRKVDQVTVEETGRPNGIWQWMNSQLGIQAPIIDARDLLTDPAKMLPQITRALQGRRTTPCCDGPRASGDRWRLGPPLVRRSQLIHCVSALCAQGRLSAALQPVCARPVCRPTSFCARKG